MFHGVSSLVLSLGFRFEFRLCSSLILTPAPCPAPPSPRPAPEGCPRVNEGVFFGVSSAALGLGFGFSCFIIVFVVAGGRVGWTKVWERATPFSPYFPLFS